MSNLRLLDFVATLTDMDPVIEVLVMSGGECVWRCESVDEESAIRDARIGWDEAWTGTQGQKREILFLVASGWCQPCNTYGERAWDCG